MPAYSFGFVCEHGSLKRQCLLCEYIEIIAEFKKENRELNGKLKDVFAAFDEVTKHLGCGDNSCIFISPKGMATNSHCRCIGYGNKLSAVTALGVFYRKIKALKEVQ